MREGQVFLFFFLYMRGICLCERERVVYVLEKSCPYTS